MPVYTKYKITEFGQRTIAKVNGFLAVLDTWYNDTDILTFHKNNPLHFGEPFDFIKYQTTDDILVSNVAVMTVNVPPDKTIDPESANTITAIDNDTEYQVIGLIPYNEAVDRIKIIDFDTDAGSLTFNGSNVFPGFVMLQYDFELLLFKSKKGTGEPYQIITYQVGNDNGYNATEYTATLNLSGLASLQLISEVTAHNDDITSFSNDVKINNGRINGIAKVNVEVNLDAAAWPVDTENFFNLAYNDDDIENNANFTNDIFVDLNNEGFESLLSQLDINDADLPITGTITFTLIDINGDTGLVDSGADQIIINVSL